MNCKQNIAILLRGHVKKSLDNDKLVNYINGLANLYNIDLYISTWNVREVRSTDTWRPHKDTLISNNDYTVTESKIRKYFSNCNITLKKISIFDDLKIKLYGELSGNVSGGNCPRLGWKKMWFGIFHGIKSIVETNIKYDVIVNTRFDINELPTWEHYYTPPEKTLKKTKCGIHFFLKSRINSIVFPGFVRQTNSWRSDPTKKHLFSVNDGQIGIDNLYVGELYKMHKLVSEFQFNLLKIENKFPGNRIHEVLVLKYSKNLGFTDQKSKIVNEQGNIQR